MRCCLADDHPLLLEGVAAALEAAGIVVVARAPDGASALRSIRALAPDVAVLDAAMPRVTGLEVAAAIAAEGLRTRSVIYTGDDAMDLLRRGVAAGAHGFVLKTRDIGELVEAVQAVAHGETWVDPQVAYALISAAAHAPESSAELTAREREVLRLVADGLTSAAIGARLDISPETVRVHVRRVMEKLSADTRLEAVATAIRRAIID